MGPTIEILDDLAAAWCPPLLTAAWQGGLAIAAMWVLVRCHRGLPPRVACWAWRMVDLKLIVAALWTAPLLLPLLPAAPLPTPVTEAFVPTADISPAPAGGPELIADPIGGRAEPSTSPRPDPAALVLVLWMAGVVVALRWAGTAWLGAARLRRSCRPIGRADLRDAAAELAAALGLRGVPELSTGPLVVRPMLVGAFRPAILLPIAMLDGPRSTDALRPVLAHELAHVRRRDLWWSIAAGLIRALFWFHPLVRLAHREALLAREADCDAMAIRAAGVRPSEYGRILLEIAAGGPERPARWAAALGMAGPAGSLRRRLMAMKTTAPPSRPRLLAWAFALLVVGAAGIVPWRPVPREAIAQEPTPPAKQSITESNAGQDPAAESKARLKLAGARLRTARLSLKAREADIEQAESTARATAARLEYRRKQHTRLDQLVQRGAVEERLLDEEEDRMREAQAQDLEAKLSIAVARTNRDAAEAAVREARAEYDIVRAGSRITAEAEAELGLEAARAERSKADARLKLAEIDVAEATTTRQDRQKRFDRISELAKAGAVEQRLVDEAEEQFRVAQANAKLFEAHLTAVRAQAEWAEAAIRKAEDRRDLARTRPRTNDGPEVAATPEQVKEPRVRLHQARVDRARAERDAARGEIDHAEASVKRAETSVEYRTKQLARLKDLVDRGAVERRLVVEEERRVRQARDAQQRSEAAVDAARTRLDAAEARLKAAEARLKAVEAEAGSPHPVAPR